MAEFDREPDNLPQVWHLYVALAGLFVFGIVTWASNSDNGALSGFAAATTLLAARSRWDLRREPYFWLCLVGVTVLHIVAISMFQGSLPKTTILLAPVVVIDFAAVIYLIYGAEWLASVARSKR